MNRAEKQEQIDSFHRDIESARSAYLVEFGGLNVAQVTDLRRRTREASARYRVVKNRLARRSIEGTVLSDQENLFVGQTAVAWTQDDPVPLAKVLAEFQKNTSLKVKGIVIEGKPMVAESLDRLTSLPSRPELIAQFAGMLRSPLIKFVLLLKAPIRDLASVLKQVADRKGT